MMPGMSARPSASIVSRAAPSALPTAAMRPCASAKSPCRDDPMPSRRSALRNTTSYMRGSVYWRAVVDFGLEGKVAIVTGAARGIGAATSRLLREHRATVVELDIISGCDVTDEEAVLRALAKAEREHGGIDILVNNAGRANRKPATVLSREEWEAVVDLNLTAVFLCS